jgi:hypothetical protein
VKETEGSNKQDHPISMRMRSFHVTDLILPGRFRLRPSSTDDAMFDNQIRWQSDTQDPVLTPQLAFPAMSLYG